MPARTLTGPHTTSRQQSHDYAIRSQSLSQRDNHDERPQGPHVLYDMTIPPPLMALNSQHNPYPTLDHRYPTAFIPPSLHGHHYSAPPLHPAQPFVTYPGFPPALLHTSSYPGGPQTSWHPPPPPLFRPPVLTPPPLIPHRVWILDCKSCSMFLTNRGMKAVLLLRPNVPLYSTDAMPINCSAFSDPGDSLLGSSFATPPSSAGSPFSGRSTTDGQQVRTIGRTCECLTQTLHCHGCGNGVGYIIVSPCHRCMSSITATNRSTNGHRFVFYSSEIVASERHYITGESGVRSLATSVPSPPLSITPPPPHSQPMILPPMGANYLPMHRTVSHPLENPPGLSEQEFIPESRRSSTSAGSHSPLSPIEFARSRPPSGQSSPQPDHRASPGVPPRAPPPSHSTSPQIADGGYSSPPSESPPSSRQSSASYELCPEPLQAGDAVFWHHLVRSGEIPAVIEDARARRSKMLAENSKLASFGLEGKTLYPKYTNGRSRGVVAGR